jgi:hypothetical protein
MISTLLSFLVGFFVFIVNSRLKTERMSLRLILFLAVGTLTGAIIGVATKSPMHPLLNIPWTGFAIMGFLTSCLLFVAQRWSLLTKPGLQYFTTILLGLAVAGGLYLLSVLFRIRITPYQLTHNQEISLIFNLLLMGFLSIFGFSFPSRRFRQSRSSETNSDE